MKSLYVRARTFPRVCVRAGARAQRVPCTHASVCESVSLSIYPSACIRIIYSARASLTAPTVTGRSFGRFSARMTVYGIFVLRPFFFSFLVSLPLVSALLIHAIHAYAREIRCNNARIPLLANISIRDIGIADIALSEARSSIGINELIET